MHSCPMTTASSDNKHRDAVLVPGTFSRYLSLQRLGSYEDREPNVIKLGQCVSSQQCSV